ALHGQGKVAEAVASFRRAHALRPDDRLLLRCALALPIVAGSVAEIDAARATLAEPGAAPHARGLRPAATHEQIGPTCVPPRRPRARRPAVAEGDRRALCRRLSNAERGRAALPNPDPACGPAPAGGLHLRILPQPHDHAAVPRPGRPAVARALPRQRDCDA